MARPKGLVLGQVLTWVGLPLPPPEEESVKVGDVGRFEDYEGDPDHYVVSFNGAVFCCKAADVLPEPRPPVVNQRIHHTK